MSSSNPVKRILHSFEELVDLIRRSNRSNSGTSAPENTGQPANESDRVGAQAYIQEKPSRIARQPDPGESAHSPAEKNQHDLDMRPDDELAKLQGELASRDETITALRSRQADLERSKSLLYKAAEQNRKATAEALAALERRSRELDALERQHCRLQEEHRALGRDHQELNERHGSALIMCRTQKEDLAKLGVLCDEYKRESEEEQGKLFAFCPNMSEWMKTELDCGKGLTWTECVAVVGSDPLSKACLISLLEAHKYRAHEPGESEAGVLIVGREGWTPKQLDQQISVRSGQSLRVYSQEMAILSLLMQRDLLDESGDVLEELGISHPALAHLMQNLDFCWPEYGIDSLPDVIDNDVIEVGEWQPNSPLTAMGYHVGKTSSLDLKERRQFLRKIFQGKLSFPAGYPMDQQIIWGDPRSSKRLRAIAEQIARNIRLRSSQRSMKRAVADWARDLDWLKKQFYPVDRRFRWPDRFA